MYENSTSSTNETISEYNLAFSYSKSHSPVSAYNSSGEFFWFSEIDVEERARVKSLSLIHSVPISSQWMPSGHIYPIQVSQYGLSHFSKWAQSSKDTTRKKQGANYFLIKDKSKFVYNRNENKPRYRTIKNGFEFDFTGC